MQGKATVTLLTETEIIVDFLPGKKVPQFEEGGKIRLRYWDEGGIYICSGEVLRTSGSSLVMLVLSEPIAMQRRVVTRLALEVPMSLQVTEASHQGLASSKVYETHTRNLSGRGVSFDTGLPMRSGDIVELQINLPSEKIGVTGEVVSSEKVLRDGKGVNSVGVEFFDMPSDTRSKLMEFLLESTPDHDSE